MSEDFDAFLKDLRAEPSPQFLAALKARLDAGAGAPASKLSGPRLRPLLLGSLAACAVLALAMLLIRVGFTTLPGIASPVAPAMSHHEKSHSAGAGGVALDVVAPPASLAHEARSSASSHPRHAAARKRTLQRVRGASRLAQAGDSGAFGVAPPEAMPASRDHILIIGSAALEPYTSNLSQRLPDLRSLGLQARVSIAASQAAFAQLCGGDGLEYPDIAMTARRMTSAELETCRSNAVQSREVILAYEVAALARSRLYGPLSVSAQDLFLALASRVPDPQTGELVQNPYHLWSEIDAALPPDPIRVLGPPRATYPGKALLAALMRAGCNSFPGVLSLRDTDEIAYEDVCGSVRQDGAYVEEPRWGPGLVATLQTNPTFLGLLNAELLASSRADLAPSPIDGVEPSAASFASGAYPAARPLYLYVNMGHRFVMPGLDEFVSSYLALADGGGFGGAAGTLVPYSAPTRQAQR